MKELDRQLAVNESVLSTRLGVSEGGSAPTESRPLDRPTAFERRERPVPIVPAAKSSDTPPQEIARAAYLDGCPECVLNTEPPRSVTALEKGARAAYLCADCGHAWTTDWSE